MYLCYVVLLLIITTIIKINRVQYESVIFYLSLSNSVFFFLNNTAITFNALPNFHINLNLYTLKCQKKSDTYKTFSF